MLAETSLRLDTIVVDTPLRGAGEEAGTAPKIPPPVDGAPARLPLPNASVNRPAGTDTWTVPIDDPVRVDVAV
jgi:hypothetical protein